MFVHCQMDEQRADAPFALSANHVLLHVNFHRLAVIKVFQCDVVRYYRVVAFPCSSSWTAAAHIWTKIKGEHRSTIEELCKKICSVHARASSAACYAGHSPKVVRCPSVRITQDFISKQYE
jgi:hypothetical protein